MLKHRLIITDGNIVVTMPTTKNITHGGELEGVETTMSDGTKKTDVVGFRLAVTYSYTYIPAEDLATLHKLLRSGKYFSCTYLDVDNVEKTAVFSISYPQTSVFMYKNGVAVWHNATITLSSKEVF